jgi:hypothetical protein|tara:strand:+ start:110 stop:322 length:213 start_codon:yes stop_codon:yes gene_type:complete
MFTKNHPVFRLYSLDAIAAAGRYTSTKHLEKVKHGYRKASAELKWRITVGLREDRNNSFNGTESDLFERE